MILLVFLYLKNRFEKDQILSKSKYLVFLSLLFIQDIGVLLLSSILFAISLIDLFESKIPNELSLSLLTVGLWLKLLNGEKFFDFNNFESFAIIFFILILLVISISSGSIGLGDVKLFAVLLLIMKPIFLLNMIFILSFIIFLYSGALLIKTRDRKAKFPLAPFIYCSFLLNMIIWGVR